MLPLLILWAQSEFPLPGATSPSIIMFMRPSALPDAPVTT
jgi:hypothetical protein